MYQVFKHAKSNGGKYMIITTVVVAILLLWVIISIYPVIQNISLLITMLSIFLAIISSFSVLIYAYYEMEYIISNEFLLIKWGLRTKKIAIENIKRVIKPETKDYEGIRLGGVGIPGYLFGKFKFLIEGNFETVSLYATKLDRLLFVETDGQHKKFYGITPREEDEFITTLNNLNRTIEPQIEEKPTPFKTTKSSSKDIKIALTLFIVSIVLSVSGLVYFLVIYFQLPQTVPLHFNINFEPNRYGNKIDLIGLISFFMAFGIGFSSLLYYYIHRRTHLDQTKYGYSVMLIPLAISLVFLIMTIVILNQTLAFV
jgi:hypothetical protein